MACRHLLRISYSLRRYHLNYQEFNTRRSIDYNCLNIQGRDRDSSVDIATCYGVDGPGIKPRHGEIFRNRPDRSWGPPSLLYDEYRVFPRGKERPGSDVDHPSLSSAEVTERVELYLYSPSGTSLAFSRENFTSDIKEITHMPDNVHDLEGCPTYAH